MLRTALLGIFTVTSLAFQSTAFAEGPFQDITYEAALKAAEKDEKIVVIDFYTTWCGPCKMLDKTTWKDEQVVAWFNDKAVGLKIDAEKEKDLAKKFKINSYPTIILLKPNGKEIDRLTGYRDAKQFLSDVRAALSGKDSLSRSKAEADKHPNDPMIRMNYGEELAQRGRNDEALEEYLWCFDEGEKNSRSFSGVRISFLLSNIAQLGSNYPPAIEALRERRERNEKSVLSHFEKNAAEQKGKSIKKKPNARGFYEEYRTEEFAALREAACDSVYISQNIGEPDRSIEFYDKLRAFGEDAKPLRARMMFILFDALADARRYKDIIADGGDPLAEIDQDIAMWQMEKAMYKKDKNRGKELEEIRLAHIIQKIARNYEVLVGAGEFDDAETAAKKLIEFEKSARTYSELIKCAAKARSLELAEELAREAKRELPADEFEKVVPLDELEIDPDDDAPGERTPPDEE